MRSQCVTDGNPTVFEVTRHENAVPDGPRNGALDVSDDHAHDTPLAVSEYHSGGFRTSPLDRAIVLTRFDDAEARTAHRHVVPLRNLAPKIASRRASRKERLPWLKLATFGDQPSAKGSLRHNRNVIAIDGIEGDHDAGTVTPADAAAKLRAAGIAALIYTSPSHAPERPRWRVLAPLSRSRPPEDRERLCARLQGVLGGALAPESFALSQSYYYGGVDGGTAPKTILVEGAALDTLDRLDSGALDKRGKPYSGGKTDHPSQKPAERVSSLPEDHYLYVPPELLATAEADDLDDIRPRPNVTKIRGALEAIPAEARDDREACWRPVGMALHAEFGGEESGFELWDEWSKVSGKYNARDQRRVWDSFGTQNGKATGIGTLYQIAKGHGWSAKAVASVEPSRLQLFTPADCMNAPARGYVIKRLIAPRDVACIFGAPGGGKSTIAPFLGYRVATGAEAFGLRTKPGRVLYVAAEDAHGMKNRVKALRERHGDAPDFYVVDGVTDLLEEDSPDLAALRAIVDDKRPALIFLDTLAMAFRDLEENDAASMNRVVAIARSLTCHEAAVVLIHHGTKAEGSTPRGHSVLNGALDVALQLLPPDADGIIRGRLSKNRNGPCDLDIAFRVASERLGTDEDGDPITAAIVDDLPAGAVPRRPKLTDGELAALTILRELEANGQPVPEGHWREACIGSRRVCQSEERDSRKKAFNRARTGLFRAGHILLTDDLVAVARQPEFAWPDDDERDEQ